MNIEDDPLIKEFFRVKNVKPNSEDIYLTRLSAYFEHIQPTPTHAIKEAEEEEDQRLRMKDRKIRQHLINFLEHLQDGDENYSFNYIKNMMGTVRSFYREYDIELPRLRIRRPVDSVPTMTTDEITTKDDIRKILNYTNPMWKAIILLMASSGMGSAELRSLTFQTLKNGLKEIGVKPSDDVYQTREKMEENKDNIITWHIRRIKTGLPYYTFSSPESHEAISEYLSNIPYLEDNDPLFYTKNREPLTRGKMTYYFEKYNDKAGFGFQGKYRFFHAHSLRKYFASTLYKHNLPQLTIDWLLGHKIDPTTQAYFKSDVESLKREYIKVVEELSIEPLRVKHLETEEYLEMQEMKAELEAVKQDFSAMKKIYASAGPGMDRDIKNMDSEELRELGEASEQFREEQQQDIEGIMDIKDKDLRAEEFHKHNKKFFPKYQELFFPYNTKNFPGFPYKYRKDKSD